MCGIVGGIGSEADLTGIELALSKLAHRGPDDSGTWASGEVVLGHRRLSILDLSARAKQPMVDVATGNVIVFNGEVYNYRELRSELEGRGHVFRTEGDTEVLLKGISEWGYNVTSKLNGMWAFAVWNPSRQELFLSRDRFGVKPLYFKRIDGGLVFASEPKGIFALTKEPPRPDQKALYRFLTFGELYTVGRSFYEGVEVLGSATNAVFKRRNNELTTWKHWQYPMDLSERGTKWQEAFQNGLESSVAFRLRSDVDVGLMLSGGLDPSSIAAIAALQRRRLRAFTAVYPEGGDERCWARTAAEKLNLEYVEVQSTRSDWSSTLRRILWHMDGPGYSPAVFPLWNIMKVAREMGTYVLLDGQGADEILGGYVQHGTAYLREKVSEVYGSHLAEPFGNLGRPCGGFRRHKRLRYSG